MPLDKQAAFNRVRRHLIAQGEPAMNERRQCVYWDDDGRRCAIGVLISDEAFDPCLNEWLLPEVTVLAMLQKSGLEIDLTGDDLDFLLALQQAHDRAMPGPRWMADVLLHLDLVASQFQLKILEPRQCTPWHDDRPKHGDKPVALLYSAYPMMP